MLFLSNRPCSVLFTQLLIKHQKNPNKAETQFLSESFHRFEKVRCKIRIQKPTGSILAILLRWFHTPKLYPSKRRSRAKYRLAALNHCSEFSPCRRGYLPLCSRPGSNTFWHSPFLWWYRFLASVYGSCSAIRPSR